MSTSNVNPGTRFTGTTWVAWGSGKVPVGVDSSDTDFDTVEETGGAKNHSYTPAGTVSKPTFTGTAATLAHSGGSVGNHTLTVSEIPSHTHGYKDYTWSASSQELAGPGSYYSDWGGGSFYNNRTTDSSGSGGSHNHPFTQPSAHSYTPSGTVSQPTFTGTAATQSHLQPYITCYMWKRTA